MRHTKRLRAPEGTMFDGPPAAVANARAVSRPRAGRYDPMAGSRPREARQVSVNVRNTSTDNLQFPHQRPACGLMTRRG
jgi:hypothetical protein